MVRSGMVDGVAPGLVGREVSVRAVIPIWEEVRGLGHDPERLATDTGYTVEQLTSATERISWDGYVRLMHNLGTLLDDDQVVAVGSSSMESPFFRVLLLPARMLFGLDEILRWAFGANGPPAQLLPVNDCTLVPLGRGHMRLELRVQPGYRASRESFLLLQGAVIGLARIAGQQATVRQIIVENGTDLDIRVPASTGLLSTARQAFSRLRPDDQLARANAELVERYAELEREIASRISAESELRRSEQRYRDLFESAPLPMWVFDVATLRFLAVNRAAVRVYGYSEEEFAAMTLSDIRPADEIAAVDEDVARFRDSTRIWQHLTKTGTILHVQVSARDLTFESRPARLAHIFDMTQRLALEEQLRQAQKMEAIGQLAGGVAHDFNNLLMVISSYAELMLRESRDSADLQAIRSAAERGADLTQKLLMFARRKAIEPRVLDLGEIVDDMRVLLKPVLESDHEIVYDLAEDHGLVRADRGGLEQVLMNLVLNARDAMPRGGTLTVTVRDIDIDTQYARTHVGVTPGPHVALVVADTGLGMDEITLGRVFEPFFTTKEVGKGTGLGLSTVLGIVQQNGGHIHVDSSPGAGTTITVCFPRCAPSREVAATPGEPTILIIEDDDVLRGATRDVLEDHGFRVVVARDAQSALAVWEIEPAIDLVVSDIVLQQASGIDLARQLRIQRPDLKVLYMSGYSSNIPTNDTSTAFLKKPFTAELLVERVRSLL